MKKLISLILITLFCSMLIAEDAKEAVTKMAQLASKTGSIIKFVDSKLPNLKLSYGVAKVKVREVHSGDEISYFLQFSKEDQHDTKTVSIAYEDLIEIIKALKTLKLESSSDIALNPDYLENRFMTDDGFQLGYYISKGKLNWYLTLERYGSGKTIFLKDIASIEALLNSAKNKIEELRQ